MLFQKHHCLSAIAKVQNNLRTASQESEAKFEALFVDNDFINVLLQQIQLVLKALLQVK